LRLLFEKMGVLLMIFSIGINGLQKNAGFAFHEWNNMDIPVYVEHQDFLMGVPVPVRMDFDGQEPVLLDCQQDILETNPAFLQESRILFLVPEKFFQSSNLL
jgi:hypothetical protein